MLPLSCAQTLSRRPAAVGESVAIIGAGMSGLTAGRMLHDSGRFQVEIFEARTRMGGRIHTVDSSLTGCLEYGACWIHDPASNPISDLCRKYGISPVKTDKESEGIAYLSDGRQLTHAQYDAFAKAFDELCRKIARAVAKSKTPMSMEEAFNRFAPKKDREIFWHFLRSTNEITYNADLSQLSAQDFDDGNDEGSGNSIIPSGYSSLIQKHANGLRVRLNCEVKVISYSSRGVTLTLKDGQVLDYDRCIVTVPLGVLKSGKIAFDPILPKKKRDAIERVGFGHFTKLFLTFPNVFWPTDRPWLEHVTSDPNSSINFFSMAQFTQSPTLVAMSGGSQAKRWEDLGKERILSQVMGQLKTIFHSRVPDPVFTDLVGWGSDPFSGGAYSYIGKGCPLSHMDDLAAPLENRLFFAGEATNRDDYASVSGAYESGQTAASQLFKLKGITV